jgi:16S rRNA (cytosine1402-N4)-methyltransferase
MVYVDGTLGLGGHAAEISRKIGGEGTLVGIDRDENAMKIARENLADVDIKKHFYLEPFSRIPECLEDCKIDKVDAILLDLGVSSLQLDTPDRGFSFREDAPLDMRMDPQEGGATAADLVGSLPEKELADTIYNYGEERFSRRIAKRIVESRRKMSIKTTGVLAEIVRKAVPGRSKIDKATRTFQALRIAVNDELGEVERALDVLPYLLNAGGRMAVISFHSLEDRLVKHAFRELASDDEFKILTKKPLVAGDDECEKNPRSRSAKLRVIERL